MFTIARAALIAGALAASALAPLPAAAASAATHLTLATHAVVDQGGGSWNGRMTLTVSNDGIIQGYFRPDNGSGPFLQVEGGVEPNGNNLWLDIGRPGGGEHFTGTLHNGHIVAEGFTRSAFAYEPYATVTLTAAPVEKNG